MCHQQYYITYVLGQPSPANLKADMGSVTHLALEWLAILKMQYDEGQETLKLNTKAINIELDRESLYLATTLSDKDVDKINRTRTNKQIYLPTAQLPYGQIRYGSALVNRLVDAAYRYFSEEVSPDHIWAPITYKHCWNWTWMALEQNNRAYDPRFRTILAPERKFDLRIEKDWAKYSYIHKGEKIDGYLGLKGTIDLVTKVDDNTIEIIDWKPLPLDTTIPTTSGWTTMKKISVGDVVYDIDGNPTNVIGKSTIKKEKCYEFTFDDGSTVESSIDHLWVLTDGIKETKDIIVGDTIPLASPIKTQTPKRFLYNNPYKFGVDLMSESQGHILDHRFIRGDEYYRRHMLNGIIDQAGMIANGIAFVRSSKQAVLESARDIAVSLGKKVHLRQHMMYFEYDVVTPYRKIIKIRDIGEKEVQCIKVDSPTNTFLCTENMIPTHNTGKMFNWGKNEPKTFESLHEDKQLMFYYYAARQIYPQYKNIILTINFIRDGGAQTIAFDDSILADTENMIRETFEQIRRDEQPKLLDPTYSDHRCRLFCPFFKRKVDDMPYCKHIADSISDLGIEYVTETEQREGFEFNHYEDPGE